MGAPRRTIALSAMRVLMLSWEFPPHLVGGLGRHVLALAEHLVDLGHDVVVLTRDASGPDAPRTVEPESLVGNGIRVVYAAVDPAAVSFEDDLIGWATALNRALIQAAEGLLTTWTPDVVHAHDWLVAQAAISVAERTGSPLVSTVHATEAGRWNGWLSGPINRSIHSLEWRLCQHSRRIIICTESMAGEVRALFGPPRAPLHIVVNGIDTARWSRPRDRSARSGSPWRTEGLLIGCVARLEYEKGVHDLIAALPRLRRRFPGIRLVVAGTGTRADWLADQARRHRVSGSITWTEELATDDLAELLADCDVAVVPSRYEPSGLTVLEAAASGTPMVVTDVGGPAEFVGADRRGLRFRAGDPAALADAISVALRDPAAAVRRAALALEAVRTRHRWPDLARGTVRVYQLARRDSPYDVGELSQPDWDPERNILSGKHFTESE